MCFDKVRICLIKRKGRLVIYLLLMVLPAQHNDIPELVKLINSAYRGEGSKQGWTTEADLLEGELRTDEEVLKELMTRGTFLKYTSEHKISGCVYLEKQGQQLYLGMLTVAPGLQSTGIGKKLLAASEDYAFEKACGSIIMNVISLRPELIGWYERHGYRRTGKTSPFPSDNKFGRPVVPLEFIELKKDLPNSS